MAGYQAPFKKGDTIRPKLTAKTSQGIPLKHVYEAKVMTVRSEYQGRVEMTIKVKKGNENSWYGKKGNEMTVYSNAFMLSEGANKDGDYSIW